MPPLAAIEFHSIFQQVAVVLLACALIGAAVTWLRQPLIVGFIAVGILAGPQVLGLVGEQEEIELLAEIGIALLLFVVGLKLDLHLVRTVGPVALLAGLGQVGFTSAFGFLIALGLGMDLVPALYVAVALTFSSTIIIVKLLSDKREVDETHGKIALGILIVQDILVVLVMIALSAFAGETDTGLAAQFGLVAVRGAAFIAVIAALMKWVLPGLLQRLARSPELLVLFSIAWAVAVAAGSAMLGFSEEVGAFVAGVSLASTGFREAIGGRLTTIRDFLLLFFFLNLGVQLDFSDAGAQLAAAGVFSVFVLVGNPIIVMAVMGVMGYRSRVSFLTGLTVAQISEFSLILAALGLTLGHIGGETMGLITLVGIITITLSTYLILYSQPIYDRLAPLLAVFERSGHRKAGLEEAEGAASAEIVVFGAGRFGGNILRHFEPDGDPSALAVDFDPQVVSRLKDAGYQVLYGDAGDPAMPENLDLSGTRWVVSTVPDISANMTLMESLKAVGFQGQVAATAHTEIDGERLSEAGADHVLMPFWHAADFATQLLQDERRELPAR